MNDYIKVGNRYYKVKTETELTFIEEVETEVSTDYVIKATYDVEEEIYSACGTWTKEEFLLHENAFDGNTETEYDNIVKELGLK